MLGQTESPQKKARASTGSDSPLRADSPGAKTFAVEEMLRRLKRTSSWLDNQVSPFARGAHKRTDRIGDVR